MPRSFSRPLALLVYGLGTLLAYGAALARFPLHLTYKTQILTLEQQVTTDQLLAPGLAFGIGLLFALYIGGFGLLHMPVQNEPQGRLWFVVLLMPLVGAAMLLFIHPTTSLDLYDYLYRGHVAARYGANNFVQSPEDFKAVDRFYWYTAWRGATTAYGPLWEALSIAVARLSGTTLFGLVLGFKLTSALAWLLCGAAIWAASQPGQRLLAAYLWLWNPLVLWELVGAGHNDGWMLLCGVLALATLRRRPLVALLLVTTGALCKYPLALLWPVLLVAAFAQQPSWRARATLLVRGGLLCAALVAAAYAPWWSGAAMLDQWRERTELFANSPLALLRALSLPHISTLLLDERLALTSLALLLPGVAVAVWQAWRRPQALSLICAGLLAWFMFVVSAWFQPWYLAWLVALLSLRPGQARLHLVVATLSLSALLIYPASSALRPLLGWPADGVAWQVLLLLLLYLPSVLMAAYQWFRPPAARLPATPHHIHRRLCHESFADHPGLERGG